MKQQINLYEIEIIRELHFDFNLMLRIVGIFVVGLLLFSSVEMIEYYLGKRNIYELEKRADELKKQLAIEGAKVGGVKQGKEAVVVSLERLESEQAVEKEMIGTLTQMELNANRGFSPFFQALAAETVSGAWLTAFGFKNNGNYLYLKGKTYDPETVPVLIENLGKEDVFRGKTFQVFEMQVDDKTKQIDFHLETDQPKEETEVKSA